MRAATKIRPQVVLDTIAAGEVLEVAEGVKVPIKSRCVQCDYISSQPVCKACLLLEGLNTGRPLLGIGKTKDGKVKKFKKVKSPCDNSECTKENGHSGCGEVDLSNLRIEESAQSGCGEADLSSLSIKNIKQIEASDLF